MGAGGSRIAVDNPFPVSTKLSQDLDKLSLVAARILSTPDIYDLDNLTRPGACGDYAVFLKRDIEKKLLPFVTTVTKKSADGKETKERLEVAYQNPRKLIENKEVQKQICSDLAQTILTLVATVVALLASIQVEEPSRETAIAGIIGVAEGGRVQRDVYHPAPLLDVMRPQQGGGVPEVADWLLQNGYTSVKAKSGTPVLLSKQTVGTVHDFFLTISRYDQPITSASLEVTSGDKYPMPKGSLRVQFLDPVRIPGTPDSLLPLRLMDGTGLPWMAGVLYKNVFRSLNPQFEERTRYKPGELFELLFRKTQSEFDVKFPDNQDSIEVADGIFRDYRHLKNDQVLFTALDKFLTQMVPGYRGVAGYQQQPYGYPQAQFPFQVPPPQLPAAAPLPYARPTGPAPAPGRRAIDVADSQFDIPTSAQSKILDFLSYQRGLIIKRSCPAVVRARTLSAKVNEDRTVQTAVCNDPYWSLTIQERERLVKAGKPVEGVGATLERIYPWICFQFLSVGNWNNAGTPDLLNKEFHEEWRTFIKQLTTEVYNGAEGAPTIKGLTADSYVLGNFTFENVRNLPVCKPENTEKARRIRFQKIQDGLIPIQGSYERHVTDVWKILNALVVVVSDPAIKENSTQVRLHPAVLGDPVSSRAYVESKAKAARELLLRHYIEVEKAYVEAAKRLI